MILLHFTLELAIQERVRNATYPTSTPLEEIMARSEAAWG
jgi:hypothetical protein